MSYCRFSSDEFVSDFYVYHSVEGCWIIHLASQRYAQHPLPRYTYPEEHKVYVGDKGGFHLTPEGAQAWLDWQEENLKMVPIDLPFAGETFRCATRQETLDKLLELEALGYHLPFYAVDRLRREIEEDENNA